VAGCGWVAGMRDGLRGEPPTTRTARQVDVLAAFVASGGSVPDAAARVGIRPSTAKRHLADLRARSGLTTEQLIYRGRAELARRAEPRARLRWGAESVRPAARRSPARQASSAVVIPGSTTSTPERPCTTTVWFWRSSLRWTATPSATGVSTRRLPTRAYSQADEQLVQLVERLGIPARRPGRDGLVQRLL